MESAAAGGFTLSAFQLGSQCLWLGDGVMVGVFRIFSRASRRAKVGRPAGGTAKKIAGGAASEVLGNTLANEERPEATLEVGRSADIVNADGALATQAHPSELDHVADNRRTLMFRHMPQPRLREQVASELQMSEAQSYADQFRKFYSTPLEMFPRDDWFYEDHEKDFVRRALGVSTRKTELDDSETSIDHTFYHKLEEYRRITNDNTRKFLLILCPEILLMILLAGAIWSITPYADLSIVPIPSTWLVLGGMTLVGFALQLFFYYVSFDNQQTRNTLGVNTYITNKFARVTHNFQEAKRHALNIERSMRMRDSDKLKEEAGMWTLAYNWLGMRLIFCGMLIRNTTFQISRNTSFYKFGGQIVCIALTVGTILLAVQFFPISASEVSMLAIELSATALVYIIATYYMFAGDPFSLFRNSLNADQWATYNTIGVPGSIAQHVGEDKLQIITFRDRNRMESGD